MIIPLPFAHQTVFILGGGRSGAAMAQALTQAGAHVMGWDDGERARQHMLDQRITVCAPEDVPWSTVDAFFISPGIPHTHPAPHMCAVLAKRAGLIPLGDTECFFRSDLPQKIIGVTGTNGKSTTVSLITHMIKKMGKSVALGGNIGISVLDLPPLESEGIYVLELSSYQLELTPSLDLDVAVLLNISPDHLERHGGMEGYVAAKRKIFENTSKEIRAVVGVDDSYGQTIYEELSLQTQQSGKGTVIPISVQRPLTYGIFADQGRLHASLGDIRTTCDLSSLPTLQGIHNQQNAAASWAVMACLGLSLDKAKEYFNSFPGIAHRQENLGSPEGITYINDSKATNTEAVARALSCFAPNHTIYWIAGGRAKQLDMNVLRPFFHNIRHTFLIGETAENMGESLTLEGVPVTLNHDLDQACRDAKNLASSEGQKSPLILLSPACTSFDQFRDFEARGEAFRDWVSKNALSKATKQKGAQG